MTSRSLLTALLIFLLLAPVAAMSGRVTGGSLTHVSAADHVILGGRGIAIRVVADAQRGNDWLAAGAGGDEFPKALPGTSAPLPCYLIEMAQASGINLPPCGLRAGPRQTTGPPLQS